MSQLTIVLFVCLCGLIALFIWNGFGLKALKNQSSATQKELNDAKYWELKYKHEFLLAIIGIITGLAAFLGYNSLQNVENSMRQDFAKKVDSVKVEFQKSYSEANKKLNSAKDTIQILNTQVKSTEKALLSNSIGLASLNVQQARLRQQGYLSAESLNLLTKQIDSINVRNKIKKEFYLVTNYPVKGILAPDNATVKFADLKTNVGDRLPIFKSPPIVIAAFQNDKEVKIMFTSATEFQVWVNDVGSTIEDMRKKTFYCTFIIYSAD